MDDQILAAMLKQFAEFLCSEENFEYNITYFTEYKIPEYLDYIHKP